MCRFTRLANGKLADSFIGQRISGLRVKWSFEFAIKSLFITLHRKVSSVKQRRNVFTGTCRRRRFYEGTPFASSYDSSEMMSESVFWSRGSGSVWAIAKYYKKLLRQIICEEFTNSVTFHFLNRTKFVSRLQEFLRKQPAT